MSHALICLMLTAMARADSLWVRLYDGPSRTLPNAAFCVLPDRARDLVYFCGTGEHDYPLHSDILVGAYGFDGRLVDAKSIGGWTGSADRGHAIVLDSAGRLFACGTTEHPGTRSWDFTWAMYEYDPAGDSLASPWVNKSFWPGPDAAFDLVRGRGNDLYLCGASAPDTLDPYRSYLAVARVNIDDAQLRWLTLLAPDSSGGGRPCCPDPELPSELLRWDCYGAAIALDASGNLIVAGSGFVPGWDREVWLVRLDTAGNALTRTLWHAADGDLEDALFDMAIAPDGAIYCCGYTETDDGDLRAFVLRADTSLAVTGARLFGPAGEQTEAWASRLCIDSASGDVFVTGGLDDWDNGWQMLAQRFSPTLAPRWPEPGVVLGGVDDDRGIDIAAHNGQAVVAGNLDDALAVVCIGTGGDPLWTWRYDSPDSQGAIAASIGCCGDEALFIGGSAERGAGEWSSLTLARLATGSGLENGPPGGTPSRAAVPVVHGVLVLKPGSRGSPSGTVLVDVSGRPVASLRPGRNDVSNLAAGIYFIRYSPEGCRTKVAKVVLVN